jgi:hypothetical protein
VLPKAESDDWKNTSEEGKRASRFVMFGKIYGKSRAGFAQDIYENLLLLLNLLMNKMMRSKKE